MLGERVDERYPGEVGQGLIDTPVLQRGGMVAHVSGGVVVSVQCPRGDSLMGRSEQCRDSGQGPTGFVGTGHELRSFGSRAAASDR